MIAEAEMVEIKRRAREQFARAGALLRPDELDRIFVEDFSLGEFDRFGLAIIQVVDTPAVNVRLYAMRAHQLCPEHRHRPQGDYPGKEETFRCQRGELYVCLPGDPTPNPRAAPPAGRRRRFTVWHETVLRAGDQLTSPPDTLHWFQAGPEGAVAWAFCSRVVPGRDEFTDPGIAGLTSGLRVKEER